jgi:hypothetical protein
MKDILLISPGTKSPSKILVPLFHCLKRLYLRITHIQLLKILVVKDIVMREVVREA